MLIPLRSVVLSVLLLANFSSARPLPSLPSSNPKVFREPVAAALASKIAAINKQIGELPVLPGVPNGLKQATTTMAAMQVKVGAPTATAYLDERSRSALRCPRKPRDPLPTVEQST
ncbi:hypothetical protein Rt10032_c06g2603 [Rhodotorula toruloides]|uniref:Uncharacterized protein n=1 Tax=Rhodotorula toruloides TaxID=5286 RepID=A0A511KF80_RHOTO|nr:hypothetical protein Rt10032_c06g2603 [Rhodotorula toruloides]